MPDGRSYVGREGVREAVENFTEAWEDLSFEPVEFIDAGEERVVAVIANRGRGRGSGAPMEIEVGWLYEMRDGKVTRARAFISKQQALEAARLSG
jgi:ketosteroid isomerase-like protein